MLKNKVGKIILVLLAALLPAAAFAELALKPADCVIVVTGKEQQFKRAAEELAFHLKEITGQSVPVVKKAPEGKYVINIGKKPAGAPEKYNAIEESYWKFSPREAWFYGKSARTVLYAVYDFLENELGVRWPAIDIVVCPKANPVKLRKTEGKFSNPLLRRYIRWNRHKKAGAWYEKMRMSCDPSIITYGHAFTDWWKEYGKIHPEYFALVQGKRAPIPRDKDYRRSAKDVAQSASHVNRIISLCVSNPAVVDQIIKNWNGKTAVLNICENDSPAWNACHCAACRALDADPKGGIDNPMGADRYVDFGNRVLKAARMIRKDAKIFYYAYNASEQPPRKKYVDPGTIIGIVPTDFRFKELSDYIKSWNKTGMTEFIYRPNWHHYFAPMGFPVGFDQFAFRIQQYLHRSGAAGYDYDAGNTFDPFRFHTDYILQHAMLEPERPFEYWEKHYAEAFGPAQQDVIDYFRFWTRIWNERIEKDLGKLTGRKNWHNFSRSFLLRINQYYRNDNFIKSGKILNRALGRKLTPQARKYLLNLKLFHDHAALMLKCYQTRSKDDIRKLIEFRKNNGLEQLSDFEKFCDDPLGIRAITEMAVPKITTPVLWHFRLDPKDEGIRDQWFAQTDFSGWDGMMPTHSSWEKSVVTEGHPSAELRKKTANYDGIAWYAQKIKILEKWHNPRIRLLLHFGAVDESAEVWLNGKKAGSHPFVKPDDWKTPFDIDITKLVDWSKPEQTVTVRVTDQMGAGGIWKPVDIRFVDNWVPVPLKEGFINRGFETKKRGRYIGWSGAAQVCPDKPQAGKFCMKQRSYGGNWDVVMYAGKYLPVRPGEKYKMTVWNRNTLIAGYAQFGIRFIASDGKNTLKKRGYIFHKIIPGNEDWRQYEQEFVIPDECGFINLYFRQFKPVGNVFWDSVELFRAEPVQ